MRVIPAYAVSRRRWRVRTGVKTTRGTVMARVYGAGRPTTGFRRGRQIRDPSEVQVGDILIGLSHQFKSQNLYRVTRTKLDRFFVVYVKPDGSECLGEIGEMCIWGFDLSEESKEWFRAARCAGKKGAV